MGGGACVVSNLSSHHDGAEVPARLQLSARGGAGSKIKTKNLQSLTIQQAVTDTIHASSSL